MVGATAEALHDHEPLERWHDGRAVVLGDAAHAMVPHQGQGANQTIEDAATLAECLAGASAADPGPALDEFVSLRRERTARVQAASRWTAEALHVAGAGRVAERDARFADPYRDLAWIHGHDARTAATAH